MTKVIFVNGPPRSGKDTVGEIIQTIVPGSRCIKMAHALKVGTHALFRTLHNRLTPATLATTLQDDTYEDMKDVRMPLFYGKTPREAYIDVSEKLIKPMFGEDFWGKIVADRIAENPMVKVWIITDSGFEPETRPIIQQVGAENCLLIRMHREGCDFSSDSRAYLALDYDMNCRDVYNDASLLDLENEIRNQIKYRDIR